MKTIILSESWSINDLFNKKFWEYNIPEMPPMPMIIPIEQIFNNIPPPMPVSLPPSAMQNEPIIEYWSVMPIEIQVKFKGKKDVFHFWMDNISDSEFIIFTDLIEERRFDVFQKLLAENRIFLNLLDNKEILKDLIYNEKGEFDSLFIEFIKKVETTDAILLNTSELIFIGGKNRNKVLLVKENFIQKGFTVLQELSFMTTVNNRNKRIRLIIMHISDED